ncbi:MAG: hypothetical protein PHW69_06870 [Elusimicrobiaceae bacterium]|nr:hypothetical protein [Elusimicrobiaceae bacterium]
MMTRILLIAFFCLASSPLMAQSAATAAATAINTETKPASPAKQTKQVRAKKTKPAKAGKKTAGKTVAGKMRGKKYCVTSLAIDYNGTAVSTTAVKPR